MAEQKSKTYIRDGRAPIPEKESTSRVMSANKAKNTKPEIVLRQSMWKAGIKGYRLHPKNIVGTPDIAFIKRKIAIFVNGCFWHRCPHCNPSFPKSNIEFWSTKFHKNNERDNAKNESLKNDGWKVLVVWECQIKKGLSAIIESIKVLTAETDLHTN